MCTLEPSKFIYIKNKEILFKKLNDFKLNLSKLIYVTDFDFTITERYDYENNITYYSSYEMYDQDLIGGDQKRVSSERFILASNYRKYEDDTSIPLEERKKGVYDWNNKAIDLMLHPNLKRNNFMDMIIKKKEKIVFRKKIKEFYEKLIELKIPIIIVSGGIKEVIEDCLKLLNIKGLEEYINNKKCIIIGNSFIFDEKTGLCKGKNPEIVYSYNKKDKIKECIEKNFPNSEYSFVLEDYTVDIHAVDEVKLKEKLGIGFLNIKPEEYNKISDEKKNKLISEYSEVYDIVCINSEGYDYLLNYIRFLSE